MAGFARKYTPQDIRLLAAMDERHDAPCGPAVKKLCERAYEVFGQAEYAALASISVSHLYNLRKSNSYTRQRHHFEKTRSKPSSIGEHRKPRPDGKPGYIRINTVHQGDLDKRKGVQHNLCITQMFDVPTVVEQHRGGSCTTPVQRTDACVMDQQGLNCRQVNLWVSGLLRCFFPVACNQQKYTGG
ncbi:MAG: hypothetical protein QGG54_17475 [Gammaproteobacteria bacterium]|nr:hypothetical protein [Gammaproteobacteria bacterium]